MGVMYMKKMYPDYNNCLVNVSNSILKYYGATCSHSTLPILDDELSLDYKNVVVILFDGLGSNLLSRHIGEDSFLLRHKLTDITSVFPATTTAATTTLITGMLPCEHCWLGWDVYVKSIDKTVTLYRNVEKGKTEQLAEYSIAKTAFPYTTIFDSINKTSNAKAYCVSPFEGIIYDADEPDQMYEKIVELCSMDDKTFVYAYCMEPDHSMHYYGTQDARIIQIIQTIDKKVQMLCDQLESTLVIITADHGHMTVANYVYLSDYPVIQNMLIRDTSIEPRATNFFVKNDMLDAFQKEFTKEFREDFILLSRQEVLDLALFGSSKVTDKFESCLGDFIALAVSDKAILDRYVENPLKGLHAGMTQDEVMIPLIIYKK